MKNKKLLFFVAASVMTFGVLTPAILKQSEKVEPDSAEYDNNTVADYYKPDVKYVSPKRAAAALTGFKLHYHNDDGECAKKELWIWADGWAPGTAGQTINASSATTTDAVFDIDFSNATYAALAKKKGLWFIVKYKKSEAPSGDEWMGKSDNTEIVYEEFPATDAGLVEVWAIPGEGSALEVYKTEEETKSDRFQAAVFNNWKEVAVTATAQPKNYKLYALTSSYMRMGKAEQIAKLKNYLIAEGTSPEVTTLPDTDPSFPRSKQFKISLKYTAKPNVQYYLEGTFTNPVDGSDLLKTKYVAFHKLYNDAKFEQYYNYEGTDLGATYNPTDKSTTFKVWAPTSARVRLLLYESGIPESYDNPEAGIHGSDSYGGYNMAFRPGGVWEVTIKNKDLKNTYYNYYVVNSLGENITVDPYAKACGINGDRGMIVDWSETNPEGWANVPEKWDNVTGYDLKSPNELSIYETHIRDLTMDETWTGKKERGTFPAFVEKGTRYTKGATTVTTGFDHLQELGVTAVQLIPVFDQDNVEDKENRIFNWGYNPKNYNCVEGSYSTDPFDGAVRVKEFKELVQAFANPSGTEHKRVIMDVVYNHVNSATEHPFHILMPRYFFRMTEGGNFYNGSGCGNEVKTEAPMCRKYVVDSLVWWASQYKIKGFRFDLMGLIDVGTIDAARKALYKVDPDIYIYGEGWTGDGSGYDYGTGDLYQVHGHEDSHDTPGTTTPEQAYKACYGATTAGVYRYLQPVANACYVGCFNDTGRDNLKGKNNIDEQPWGFINQGSGDVGDKSHAVMDMLMGYHNGFGGNPYMSISYASCHDNYTLVDQFTYTVKQCAGKGYDEAYRAVASTECAIMMSNGAAFINGGEELFRTKEVRTQADKDLVKSTDSHMIDGKLITHNSYNLSDDVNSYKWDRKISFNGVNTKYYYEQIKNAVALRKEIKKYSASELNAIQPYKDSGTAEIQIYNNLARDGEGYPVYGGATVIGLKINTKYYFYFGGGNDSGANIGRDSTGSQTQRFLSGVVEGTDPLKVHYATAVAYKKA